MFQGEGVEHIAGDSFILLLLLSLQCDQCVFVIRWDHWSLLIFGVIVMVYFLCSHWIWLVVEGMFSHQGCWIGVQCSVVMSVVVVFDIFCHCCMG